VTAEIHVVFLWRWSCNKDAGNYTASQHVIPKCKSSLVQFINCEQLQHLQHRFLRCDVVCTGRRVPQGWTCAGRRVPQGWTCTGRRVPQGWTNLLSETWKQKNEDGGRSLVAIYQITRRHITGSRVLFMLTAVRTFQSQNKFFILLCCMSVLQRNIGSRAANQQTHTGNKQVLTNIINHLHVSAASATVFNVLYKSTDIILKNTKLHK
jgi:hypothetical protein